MKPASIFVLFSCLFLAFSSHGQAPLAAKVAMHNGRPTLFINNEPQYPMFYSLTDVPGGRWAWEEVPRYNMKQFCERGIRLVQVDISFDHVWHISGNIVIDTVQRQLKAVLENCPGAAVFIRFHVNPPKWWQRKFPEENTLYADRDARPDISWGLQRFIEDDEEVPMRTSIASEKWKTEATGKFIELLEKLQQVPEANALAGIQVAGGVYGEWHYWGFIEADPDVALPMQQYFRRWLTAKYKNDKALQKSWANAAVTLATATVPSLTARRQTSAGVFRDPVRERQTIDYFEAQHQVVAESIIHFCKVAKEHWPRPLVTGAFYGYFYAVFGREAAGGHLQLRQVLASPYVDYLSAPGTYYPSAVEMGDPYRSRSLIHSVNMHGKLWLDEMDQQTPLLPLKDKSHNESVVKSVAQVRRNVMFTLTQGQGLWFYDFGPAGFNGGPRLADHGTFGWWDEPTVQQNIKQLKALGDRQWARPHQHEADVLLVHDTESFYYIGSDKKFNEVAHRSNNWLPVAIFKSGAVHDVIHLDDLDRVNLCSYKTIVFVNTYTLSSGQKKLIREKVATDQRHLVWVYAPGYTDGKRLRKEFVDEVTGVHVAERHPQQAVSLVIDNTIVPDYRFTMGHEPLDPMFIVDDPQAKTLGLIEGTTDAGFASKALKGSTSWFLSLPADHPALWRHIFRQSGAHLYNESGDVFYAGNGVVTVHSKAGGQRTIKLRNGKSVSLTLAPNTTVVLDSETGEVLMH